MKPHSWLNYYEAPDPALWQGRVDVQPFEQLYQHVQCLPFDELPKFPTSSGFAIVGFCSDEGVRRNQGRIGAALGPLVLRKMLGKLSAHFFHPISLFDVGNIVCQGHHLEEAQVELGHLIQHVIEQNLHPIVIGGGHETAWGHYQGLKKHASSSLGIINIDAHFDLRPLNKDFEGHSGSPFLQIAKDRKANKLPFDYFCVGIQKNANTQSLFETARQWNVQYLEADDLFDTVNLDAFDQFIERHQSIYLSICLDALAAAFAPGVSAPQPLGLTPHLVMSLIKRIVCSGKVIGVDFVELSPPLDQDNKTAMLAASLVITYLNEFSLLVSR